jgi:hypothetical protein
MTEEGGRVVLEVRTKKPELQGQLVGYSLRGMKRAATGFLIMCPDVEGWFAALTAFDAKELYARLDGRCEDLLVSPIDVEVLTAEETEALLDSVARALEDEEQRAGWMAWAETVERRRSNLSENALALVRDVRHRLRAPTHE